MKLFGYNIARNQAPAPAKRKKGKLSEKTTNTPIDRVSMQMDSLTLAVDDAKSIFAPNRNSLMLLYDQVAEDDEVKTQMRTATVMITGAPFTLRRDSVDDEDATKLLQKPWFTEFLKIVLSAEFYGYTLAEFGEFKDGEFQNVEIFNRRHVNPVNKQILAYPLHQEGIPYGDNLLNYFLIELGNAKDLGLMRNLAVQVIWKTFSLVDWSQFNETYGQPMVHIATDTDDVAEVNKRAAMAANFGRNRWLVTDEGDTVTLIEPKSAAATGANFGSFADRCDRKIAKLINGQDAGAEKAFVGSAEVSERILNEYTRDRLKSIETVINFKLLPFLIYYGYPLDGLQFFFTELEENKNDIGTGQSNDDGPGTGANKPTSTASRSVGGASKMTNSIFYKTTVPELVEGKKKYTT